LTAKRDIIILLLLHYSIALFTLFHFLPTRPKLRFEWPNNHEQVKCATDN